MKAMKRALFAGTGTLLLTALAVHAQDDTGRSMPGASTSGAGVTPAPQAPLPKVAPNPGAPQSKPLDTNAYADALKVGDYVELDESIKNEMYGTIDFPNADIKDIIRAIGKLSGKNFILDRKIEGKKITIISPQAVTKQEAYNAFLSALYMNDLTLVAMGKFLKIVEAKSALQNNIRLFVGDYAPASEEMVTVLYPMKHLNAEEIQRFLTDLVPRNGRISYYPNTNTLVMTDTGLNLRRIIGILKAIDIPGHEDQLETIPIIYAQAKNISGLIDDILEAQTGRRASGPPGVRGQPQKTRGGGIITKIVPDERTNSLVVLANGRGIKELRDLISKLDTPNAAGGGNIHIYYCKNAVAEELAGTINSLVSSSQSGRQGAVNIPPPAGIPPLYNNNRGGGSDGVKLEGNIKVTADKATNSLVVVASGSDYAALKSVLRRLDIPRRQVYVQGTIMEINVTDSKDLGVGVNVSAKGLESAGAFIPSTGITKAEVLAAAANGAAGLQGLVALMRTPLRFHGQKVGKETVPLISGVIKAIVDAGQGQILHEPQILTSDNQDAEIRVTTKVPYEVTTTTSSNPPTTAKEIRKEEVVTQLKLTPQLGENTDLIKLKIEQAIDSFEKITDEKIQTTQRKATTTVVVRDGDTVVVGGLQKTETNDSRSKFPLLGDLPILGWLFKGAHMEQRKSNLVLFLTPRIIKEYSDILKITQEKIDERKVIGEEQWEPGDRLRKDVDKLSDRTQNNMAKAPPQTWGFRPKNQRDDDNDDDGKDQDEKPEVEKKAPEGKADASAYIDPKALETAAPPALQNDDDDKDDAPGTISLEGPPASTKPAAR